MKRILLTGTLLMGALFAASAQEQVITSFEASETAAFVLGDDIGNYSNYNWSTYSTASQSDVDTGVITISDDWSSDGDQSLKFLALGTQGGDNNAVFTPAYNLSTLAAADFQVGADFYTDLMDAQSSSNLWYQTNITEDGTSATTTTESKVMFDYSGTIYVWDPTASQAAADNYGYQDTGVSLDAATTYTVRVGFNLDGTISYYVNDFVNPVYTFTPDVAPDFTSNYFYQVLYNDDYDSNWYVDKMSVYVPTSSVKEQSLSQFEVYPNPSNGVVNINNVKAQISEVTVVDINGRTVKSVKFEGVATAQVNISDLSNGVYMMTIASDKGTVTKKVVKN